jgi:uncharacterized coiled-coil protein SlyX
MNQLIQLKKGTPLFLVAFGLAWFGLSPAVQAVSPAPDGGYAGGNTAEGDSALLSLTTGGFNTAVGLLSLRTDTTNSFNTAIGAGTLLANTADENTATGAGALLSNTTANGNTANGASALASNTEGNGNTAIGDSALTNNTTGGDNTAIGDFALANNTTGTLNTALGNSAGNGVNTANNVICIGTNGADLSNSCFIGQIFGQPVDPATGTAVFVDTNGKLGTMVSSRRFKHDIKPMDKSSEAILALKPVTFHYKSDSKGTPQFGLIAEDVAAVNPDLVVRDKHGEIYTVRYDAVNAMLLNEFLKEHRKVKDQEARIGGLKSRAEEQEATIAQLKKDFRATVVQLTARLDEQAAQIQKVTAQFEASKPAQQIAVNNQ